MLRSTGLLARFSLLARRHYGLPAFVAIANVRIVLPGRSAVVPVAGLRRNLNRLWWRRVNRRGISGCRIGLAVGGCANGHSGNGQYGSRADPVGAMTPAMVAITVIIVVAMMVLGRTIAIMAVAVSVSVSGGAERKADGNAEAGYLFHGLAHNYRIDEPNNAAGPLPMTCAVYVSVSNCCRRTAGMCCETMCLLQQVAFGLLVENPRQK